MVLPSSGQISLDQIHVEAGGTSGTQSNINSTANRDLISEAAGDTASNPLPFSLWYGAAAGGGAGSYPFIIYGNSTVGQRPGWFANGYGWGSVTSSNGTSPIAITNSSASIVGVISTSSTFITVWGIGTFSSHSSLTLTSNGITAGSKTGFLSQNVPAQSIGSPTWSGVAISAANTWSSGNSYTLSASI